MQGYSRSVAMRMGRAALIWVAVAGALYAFWLLLTDTREEPQLLLGIAVAAIGATGSELVRHQRIARVGLRWRWLPRLWRPLANVPGDLARLTLLALRAAWPGAPAPAGRLRALEFEPGEGNPADLGRAALAELAGSISPNTYVIGLDGERRLLLVHQLDPDEQRPRATIDPLGLRRRKPPR